MVRRMYSGGATIALLVVLGSNRGIANATPDQSVRGTQAVEVLAYGFSGIDERDLGVMFTADLSRVDGSPRLFEKVQPKRVARHELDKHVFRASETNTVEGGVQFLFVGLDVSQSDTHDALVYHSHEVKDVITIDDASQRSSKDVPPDAVFYLAEVHTGSTVDLTIEGDYTETGQKLSLLFTQGSVSGKTVQSKVRADVHIHGLGVSDVTGEGAFAMTLDDVRKNFRADPAPIELVFRTLPGRTYQPKRIERVIDEANLRIADGKTRSWSLQPGKYRVFGTSAPNGLATAWAGVVDCDQGPQPETRRLETTCSVRTAATLTIKNPGIAHDIADEIGSGPDETMNVFVARLPEQIEVADSDMLQLIKFFDRLVAVVVSDGKNCNRMAADLNAHLDASADVIEMGKRHTEKTPDWLTAYMNESAKKMMPAVQSCASNAAVKAAFERLGAK